MSCLVINHLNNETNVVSLDEKILLPDNCYLTFNGHLISETADLKSGYVYHVVPRLVGGKGGFGSMLRAIGAQIEKTTNHEACRDISGRRMRDVNNEKQLKEWLAKKVEKDRQKEKEKQERRERRRAMPNHKFEDETYHEQRKKVAENQEDAILQGLQKVNRPGPSCTVTSETESVGVKRKATDTEDGSRVKSSKKTEWLGIDIDNLSDLDSDDEDSASDQDNKPSSSHSENSNQSNISNLSGKQSENMDNETVTEKSSENVSSEILSEEMKSDSDNGNKMQSDKGALEVQANNDAKDAQTEKESRVELLRELEKIPPKEIGSEVYKDKKTENEKNESITNEQDEPINLDEYNSAEELLSLGLDRLKSALIARKMKCGGNLEQRAERLFSVKGLADEDIPQSLLAKPFKKK